MAEQQQNAASAFDVDFHAGIVALCLMVMCAAMMLAAPGVQAQTFTVLHAFTGGDDGGVPVAGLAMDRAGNLYGTTFQNGQYSRGMVFRLAPKGPGWIFTPLYAFDGGADGGWPVAEPTVAPDGSLYGTTLGGGLNNGECPGNGYQGCGVVFHLQPQPSACKSALCSWSESAVYSFTGGTDGWNPRSEVVMDQAGSLYGTAYYGGIGSCYGFCGIVFKLTNSAGQWSKTDLHDFAAGIDGASPAAGVVFGNAGCLYGTTFNGGGGANCRGGCGIAFVLTPSGGTWTEHVLHAFQSGSDGEGPWGGVVVDAAGNVYGTTLGGPRGTCGLAYALTPSGGNWMFGTIADFHGDCGEGSFAGMVMDAAGNLYGTIYNGGAYGAGAVFKLTPSASGWTYASLHDFTLGDDGGFPESSLVVDESGVIYGTASSGGSAGGENCYPNEGCGVVFEITQ